MLLCDHLNRKTQKAVAYVHTFENSMDLGLTHLEKKLLIKKEEVSKLKKVTGILETLSTRKPET